MTCTRLQQRAPLAQDSAAAARPAARRAPRRAAAAAAAADRAADAAAPAAPAASRREVLRAAAGAPLLAAAAAAGAPPPAAAAGKGGFVPFKDAQDGYAFAYPFGWQEVAVDGQDAVFKDVIEPLESVSVAMVPTDKKDVSEFGPPAEVALTLATKVLTAPSQTVKLVSAEERVKDGRRYVDFEFTAAGRTFTRHAVAAVTVGNGKFYTLVTGANERRWAKMGDKVRQVVRSFEVTDRF